MNSKTAIVAKNKKLKHSMEPDMKILARIINNKLTKTNMKQVLILPVIIWNKNKFLKFSDFKKLNGHNHNASAISAIGFESEPFIEHMKKNGKFKFKIKDMHLHAIFIPNLSWMMKNLSKKNIESLLKHEQGHFDLAEEITRKTRIKINNSFQNRDLIAKGMTEGRARKNAISQTTKIRKKIDNTLQKQLNIQEIKYDNKTDYGLIKKHQKKYNRRFEKLRN